MTGGGEPNTAALVRNLTAGNRRALAKAITLLESQRVDQRQAAAELLVALAPLAGRSLRIGISGAPGVGKSTFIETFGQHLLAEGHRVAVLAIDPSSPLSGGSILGDRVRMATLSNDERVFIRPSPAGSTLGGTARHTREAIVACEAAGFDRVLVETVGVGQSETLAASMVDCFLILHLPNSGDELQGIKRGILELADLVAVTKADGALAADARRAKGQLERALMLARGQTGRLPAVHVVSGLAGTGVAELAQALSTFVDEQQSSGAFIARRKQQAGAWFRSEIVEQLVQRFAERADLVGLADALEAEVENSVLPARVAAGRIVAELFEDVKKT